MASSPQDHPFYRPLWRRVAIVAVTAAWAAFEAFKVGDGFWTVLAVGVFIYATWTFLISWKPPGGPPQG